MELRLVCPPGLEHAVSREAAALGLTGRPRYLRAGQHGGGLGFEGGLEALYRANLWPRTAERVLVRLGRFRAGSFADLEAGARRLPWADYLPPGRRLRVRAECRRSKLYHEKGVAQRVAEAAGAELSDDEASSQIVYVRVEDDEAVLDLDASGEPLHRRGYRQAVAKAPLRETLAACLLLESGWDPATPLLDPFCGSGTIPIEAALLARRMAPGRARRFAFMEWPSFDAALWKRLTEEAAAGELPAAPPIAGSDRDEGAVASSRANAERAGVADSISFSHAAVSAAEPPPGTGTVVANPPYGLRVQGRGDPRDVYAQFGKLVAARCPGWRVALVCPDESLARATGLALFPGPSTKNGGLDVRFWLSR